MKNEDIKRLFFGFELCSPWPDFPKARLLDAAHRHLTMAFLGNVSHSKVMSFLEVLPKPDFLMGHAGILDRCLFLPIVHPHVVAYHFQSFQNDPLLQYQKALSLFLENEGYSLEKREFLPHVTIGRSPLDEQEWEDHFNPLPAFYQNLHLYESKGKLCYEPIWTFPLKPPFEEIEHVADIAFRIHGQTLQEIHLNAQMALCFECPLLLPYLETNELQESLEAIIIHLNEMVTRADQEMGAPFKAVSFHGEIKKSDTLEWEMIVDV